MKETGVGGGDYSPTTWRAPAADSPTHSQARHASGARRYNNPLLQYQPIIRCEQSR